MTTEKTEEAQPFADARFDRTWMSPTTWEGWYGRWQKVECFEEALGLLHRIRISEPQGVRFLIAYVAAILDGHCSSEHRCPSFETDRSGGVRCYHGDLASTALRKLVFGVLKPTREPVHRTHDPLDTWWQFKKDPSLLPRTLSLLEKLSRGHVRSDDARAVIVKFLDAWYREDAREAYAMMAANRRAMYEVTLLYGGDLYYHERDAVEHLDTLHQIAFAPRRFGPDPTNLDEASVGGDIGARAARHILVHGAQHRVDSARRAKEKRERDHRNAEHELERVAKELEQLQGAEGKRAELMEERRRLETIVASSASLGGGAPT